MKLHAEEFLSPTKIKNFFSGRLKIWFPQYTNNVIKEIHILPEKASGEEGNKHYALRYSILLAGALGPSEIHIWGNYSQSGPSRSRSFKIMQVVKNNLKHPEVTTPKPLAFYAPYKMLFYQEIPGTSLHHYLKRDHGKILKVTALIFDWLEKLHKLPLTLIPFLKRTSQESRIKKVFNSLPLSSQQGEYKELVQDFFALKNLVPPAKIVHGDMHIENIVVNGDKIGILDFEYTSIDDPLRDFANFVCLIPIIGWGISPQKKLGHLEAKIKGFYLKNKPATIIRRFHYQYAAACLFNLLHFHSLYSTAWSLAKKRDRAFFAWLKKRTRQAIDHKI